MVDGRRLQTSRQHRIYSPGPWLSNRTVVTIDRYCRRQSDYVEIRRFDRRGFSRPYSLGKIYLIIYSHRFSSPPVRTVGARRRPVSRQRRRIVRQEIHGEKSEKQVPVLQRYSHCRSAPPAGRKSTVQRESAERRVERASTAGWRVRRTATTSGSPITPRRGASGTGASWVLAQHDALQAS